MVLAVKGTPRLHALYGFSVNVIRIRPVGEGSIKKAATLLEQKLAAEGLFDAERKRPLPYPPQHIGLVTSSESAAYHDFMKVLGGRWGGVDITLVDVQVQGDVSPAQVSTAIVQLNQLPQPPDVIVVTRGGGSAEDLQAFSTEQVTRAVAASRVPTIVAVGHEVDVSLAELAADQRASTPSNAAELLVPDRRSYMLELRNRRQDAARKVMDIVRRQVGEVEAARSTLHSSAARIGERTRYVFDTQRQLLAAYDPHAALQRGYALVRHETMLVRSGRQLQAGDDVTVQLHDARVTARIKQVSMNIKEQTA